jgi:transaldolase|tara:strand:- start:14670 stop:15326 length:657 start_codon:yes stop_codon:yes gene_type:complete
MKILIDTLDLKEIKKYSDMGIISGVTTNPTFSKRFGMEDDIDTIKQVSDALGGKGDIYIEAFGHTMREIEDNAHRISNGSSYKNIIFKIPFTESGVEATSNLSKIGYKTNLHLIYSVTQALIAEQAGATYICPLVGRMDDVGNDGVENVIKMKKCYDTNSVTTKIMGSSIRNVNHVIELYKVGIDAITIPPEILEKMFYHPLTDSGFKTFAKDLKNIE